MFLLQLNSIYERPENRDILFRAETREELIAFVQRERVDQYVDVEENNPKYTYNKSFRKGGPLEGFNPPDSVDDPSCYVNVRTLEEHLKDTEQFCRKRWDETVMSRPTVPA
jgi:hypothetical protein